MKLLFAAAPFSGHVNPLLGTAQLLAEAGHEVGFYTGTRQRDAVERTGATLFPLPDDVDFDLHNIDAQFPDRARHAPGIERMIYDFKTLFIGPMTSQYRGLKQLLLNFDADAIIYEHLFYGAVPMYFKPWQPRPALIGCGITYLTTPRQDHGPHGPALPFATDEATRQAYRLETGPAVAAAVQPLQDFYTETLRGLGVDDHRSNFGNAPTVLADAFWQTTVPSFDYPQSENGPDITFMGAMPQVSSTTPLPPWADELEKFGRVVLITQGTVANDDLTALVSPALAALADEADTLVLVTGGGRALDELGNLPANARVATYLPFDWLMPKIDLLITNGGYGTVNQALAAGVPIIVGGSTEDKPEVSARIAWSGAGINLKTATPTPEAIRDAFRQIFDGVTFRNRIREIADEFGRFDSAGIILQSLSSVVEQRPATWLPVGRRAGSAD